MQIRESIIESHFHITSLSNNRVDDNKIFFPSRLVLLLNEQFWKNSAFGYKMSSVTYGGDRLRE